jgi:hypothetical protein
MLPIFMLEIRYYVAANGHQPFAEWFADLDPVARAKVVRAIARMEQGNLANVKSVGEGVLEYKRGPRIIATDRQAPRVYPRMIPLCSRFDSVLFTPKMSAIASYGNFSRSPRSISGRDTESISRATGRHC